MKKTPMILVLIDKKTFYNFVTGETKKNNSKVLCKQHFQCAKFLCVCLTFSKN